VKADARLPFLLPDASLFLAADSPFTSLSHLLRREEDDGEEEEEASPRGSKHIRRFLRCPAVAASFLSQHRP